LQKIKFGTDGWRDTMDGNFTFDNVKIVAQAVADYVNNVKDPKELRGKELIVGYDSRKNSKEFADTVTGVLTANGIKVLLCDRITPTPAISFAIKKRNLTGGVIITASHNPPQYNGIKYKAFYSGSADPGIIKKIEANLCKHDVKEMTLEDAKAEGLLKTDNVIPEQLDFLSEYVDIGLIKSSGLKVLIDSMHGAAGRYAERLISGKSCRPETIHAEPRTDFGGVNPEPIEQYLNDFLSELEKGKYDVGLALDGDVDRIGAGTPDGKFIDAQYIMALILWHFVEDKKLKGSVVTTICGSSVYKNICDKYGLKLHVTPVGFKYICDLMRKEDVLIGGEEAGGIGFKDYIPERDGILSGFLLLEMMAHRKKGILEIIDDLKKEFGAYYYLKTKIKITDSEKKSIMSNIAKSPPGEILGSKVVETNTLDGIKFLCEDTSWLLFRLSGTEPILRVYAEAENEEKARRMLDFGKEFVTKIK